MYLIIGLGNPGIQYEITHHNIGYIIVDAICRYWDFHPFYKRENYLIASGLINEKETVLLKSCLLMNKSGIAVAKAQSFYKLSLDNIIVIHDDADLKFGRIKIKKGGSSAGHNGLKSIDDLIGNNYWRLRFGIDKPANSKRNLANYVLSNFRDIDSVIRLTATLAKDMHLVLQRLSSRSIISF